MYKSKPSTRLDFYNLLFESNDFTSELGKVVLSSGKLEVELIKFLKKNNIKEDIKKATLGKLISLANKNNLLAKNEKMVFELIKNQRNYLIHNIFSLLSNLIEETELENEDLLDSDVQLFIERAALLNVDLIEFSDMITNK